MISVQAGLQGFTGRVLGFDGPVPLLNNTIAVMRYSAGGVAPVSMPINGTNRLTVGFSDGSYLLSTYVTSDPIFLSGEYSLALFIPLTISSAFGLESAFASGADIALDLSSGLGLADTFSPVVEIPIAISTGIGVSDSLSTQFTILVQLSDAIGIRDSIRGLGEILVGYVINANTNAVSKYSGWDFTSMTQIGQDFYATGSAGLVKLSGDQDNGNDIEATIRTGKFDFDSAFMKRMLKAYLGVASNGTILLKTITNDGDERIYQCTVSNQNLREKKVDLGRGVQSRYWQFELVNSGGSDFTLESIEYFPVVMSRHF